MEVGRRSTSTCSPSASESCRSCSAQAGRTRGCAADRCALRAFAAVTALSLPLLALETASYDVRFGGPDVVRDRYLFYLAPLLLLATAVCLMQERLPLVGHRRDDGVLRGDRGLRRLRPRRRALGRLARVGAQRGDPRSVRRPFGRGLRRPVRRPDRRDLPRVVADPATGCARRGRPWPYSPSRGAPPATPSTGC